MLFCKCTFLDDTDVDVKIGKEASGNDLFNRVCDYLGIKNRNLLGLVHKTGTLDSSSKWWIRTDKLLRKQMKGKCQVWTFSLLLKLYPKRNFDKLEEITRRFAVVQIREDLVTQRLPCPTNTLSILCGYWAQSELGDFKCDEIDKKLLLGQFKFVAPRNCRIESEFEEEAIKIHKNLRGMSTADAEVKFLHLASTLPLYGSHFYPSHEAHTTNDREFQSKASAKPVMLGVGLDGFHVQLKKSGPPKTYTWSSIHSVAYKRRCVVLKLTGKRNHLSRLAFAFDDSNRSKTVWRVAVDMHMYFRKRHENGFEMPRKCIVFGKKQVKFLNPTSTIFDSTNQQKKIEAHELSNSIQKLGRNGINDCPTTNTPLSSPAPLTKGFNAKESSLNLNKSPLCKSEAMRKNNVDGLQTNATQFQTKGTDLDVSSHISYSSDNTDVLCSENIIEKTFSYAEKDGTRSLRDWLEFCSQEKNLNGLRITSQSAPASRRSFSPLRVPSSQFPDDIDDYNPFIRSKYPLNLPTTRYNDRPHTMAHFNGDAAWDDRQSEPERMEDENYLYGIYHDEYWRNIECKGRSQRRVKSMYSLAPSKVERLANSSITLNANKV